ncbi:DUF982 domain-containing protein [Neorhizobium sp. P12A]|uniref:DUF982 domain-containing protein n=1 Tax=Neorhizobium sp. P12A TaxID=2268027 RepID=UPI0011ED9EB0|nr:DUF982 domain-containing protein [Neorhizobium sp. P12A]KAA0692032.1 DUF982 domain-containing protein [Neorhizobium sp. P12A]
MESFIRLNVMDNQYRASSIPAEWGLPVVIEVGAHRNPLSITSALEAACCLLDDWPLDGSEAMENALEVCFAACKGRARPEEARLAFLQAVNEAEFRVRPHFGGH